MDPIPLRLSPLAAEVPEPERTGFPAPLAPGSVRPTIGVVRNPRSHRNRTARAQPIDDRRVHLVAPHSRDELARALAGFADRGVDLLVVDGGDGTVRDILSRGADVFGDKWPVLAILPKGKTNALAWDLGLPRQWSAAEAVKVWGSARIETRRPLLVERIEDGSKRAMGFILGAGVFNTAIEAGQVAHRFGAFQGFAVGVTAGWGILQVLFGFGSSPWRALAPIRVCAGGEEELPRSAHGAEGRRFGIGMSSLGRFPPGLKPFGRTNGGIHCLVLDAPLRRVMALIPSILMGAAYRFMPRVGIHRAVAEEYVLDLGEGFILDGEAFPPGRYRVREGPELRFLVP